MAIQPSRLKFLQTLAAELTVQADRIRLLIGDRHWHTDGSHKEAILISLLSRYLPCGFIAVRGFVVNAADESLCSSEQDILILDTRTEQPLFLAGNVAIAYSDQTVAAISVKTTIDKKTIRDAGKGLKSIDLVDQRPIADWRIWRAAFFYRVPDKSIDAEAQIVDWVRELGTDERYLGWNMLCVNPNVVLKAHSTHDVATDSLLTRYQGYSCPEMAAALFLSTLLDIISEFGKQAAVSLPAFLDEYTPDVL